MTDDIQKALKLAKRLIISSRVCTDFEMQLARALIACAREVAELRADKDRLDWIIAEICKRIWSPGFIAWLTETSKDRESIDAARKAPDAG